MHAPNEIVWIRKAGDKSIYWPAIVKEVSSERKGAGLWVQLWGQDRRKRADVKEVVKFLDGFKISDFKNASLKIAIKQALKWRKNQTLLLPPQVRLNKEDVENYVHQESKPTQRKGGPKPSLAAIINSDNAARQSVLKEVKEKDGKKEVSEYEKLRLKNIADRAAMFAALKRDFAAFKKATPSPRGLVNTGEKRKYERGPKLYSSRSEPVKTRTRSRLNSEAGSENSSGQSTPKKRNYFFGLGCDSDEEFLEPSPKKTRVMKVNPGKWMHDPNAKIPSPDEITDEMLDNVADRVSEKVYGQTGTSCHQCRQKTLDTKTVCRSGRCAGIRGNTNCLD